MFPHTGRITATTWFSGFPNKRRKCYTMHERSCCFRNVRRSSPVILRSLCFFCENNKCALLLFIYFLADTRTLAGSSPLPLVCTGWRELLHSQPRAPIWQGNSCGKSKAQKFEKIRKYRMITEQDVRKVSGL